MVFLPFLGFHIIFLCSLFLSCFYINMMILEDKNINILN